MAKNELKGRKKSCFYGNKNQKNPFFGLEALELCANCCVFVFKNKLLRQIQTLFNKISGKKCTHVQEFAYICRLKTDIH